MPSFWLVHCPSKFMIHNLIITFMLIVKQKQSRAKRRKQFRKTSTGILGEADMDTAPDIRNALMEIVCQDKTRL